MLFVGFLRDVLVACLMLSCVGCGSLGLSCFPTGHYLTDKTQAVIDRAPRHVQIPRELAQGVVPAHYLQPGDGLLIEPIDLRSEVRIPADQQVLIDGSIDLAAFGRVVVAGLTLEMAEDLVERTIVDAGEKKTRVNVRLLESVDRYYVLGEVNSPGSYRLQGHETVLDAIVEAGGLTTSAAPCKILLARPTSPSSCRITLPVCYRDITQLGETTTNYQLQPSDRIFVASRTWCEELKFWNASKTCVRCCDCQSACIDPAIVGYANPVTQIPGTHFFPEAAATDSADPRAIVDGDFSANVEAIVRDASALQADTAVNDTLPARLPSPTDGELDSGPTASTERFEPLWITPPPEPERAIQ